MGKTEEAMEIEGLVQAQEKITQLKGLLALESTTISITVSPDPAAYFYCTCKNITFTVTIQSGTSVIPKGSVTFTNLWQGSTKTLARINLNNQGSAVTNLALGLGANTVTTKWTALSGQTLTASYSYATVRAPYYSVVLMGAGGNQKCYEIPGAIYGIHMPSLLWVPGQCDRYTFPQVDCWYSWDQEYQNGPYYYVYRRWGSTAPCPETGCCCGGDNVRWGDCVSNFKIGADTCASLYYPPSEQYAQNWITCPS